jgi:hypothetical protein
LLCVLALLSYKIFNINLDLVIFVGEIFRQLNQPIPFLMKNLLILAFCLIVALSGQAQFDSLFFDRGLRIDLVHAGTATSEWYALDEIIAEPYWGGSKTNLVDTLKYGQHFLEVYDEASNELIYSRGYGSLFGEWQTTIEAKTVVRSFAETVLFPFPKNPVKVLLYSRNRNGLFDSVFGLRVDPGSYFIKPLQREQWPVFEVEVNALPERAVDIVLLADGYTLNEMGKFINDSRDFVQSLFSFEPLSTYRHRFNIRAVLAPSMESGAGIPADSVWPHTILSSSFYTFDSERYCMTMDHKKVRDLAANAPYDQIYILLNTKKYGGGGIYNFYSLSTVGNTLSAKVIVHEFGHGFAGLGDEYYDSSTAYNDFYNLEIEPWEPNLTTLVDFEKKWPHLIADTIPIPTTDTAVYKDVTGVFEGGGYV